MDTCGHPHASDRPHWRWQRSPEWERPPVPVLTSCGFNSPPTPQPPGECLPGACPAHYLCIKYLISSPKLIPTHRQAHAMHMNLVRAHRVL